ncbi:tetratricopeptide repeat protein, partial [Geitlerinema sp. P-1104]|uniref:tetratricopeptide repeat protein n=1 Tax=Geitlerinema sp. P-1104 TaxID=2546230 RepID=UPI0014769BA7
QQNWDYQADGQTQQLQVQRQGLTVLISLEEDGEFVKMVLPQLLTLPSDHPHYEAALQCLLHLGWQQDKLVRWQRDPRDGEVRLEADLPLEDGELSSRQFWRTLQGCLQIAQEGREQVQQVLQTGTVASKTDALPLLRILLQAEVSGGAEAVYRELDQRGGGVDPNLAEAAQQFLQQAAESANQERLDGLVGVIENLAISLQNYPRGRREQNVAMAILLYEIVLDARPYDRLPDKWAQTQTNLGNAYSDLPTGDRAENLQQAITCYTNALRFRTPETTPLDWAMTQNNLGTAYQKLPTGDRAENLQQAITCYHNALRFWTPERAPLDWAMTQNNLGNAYSDLPTGDRAENLQQAIRCYTNALGIWTPQLFPLNCLQTARNWGNLEFGEGNW